MERGEKICRIGGQNKGLFAVFASYSNVLNFFCLEVGTGVWKLVFTIE